MKNNNVPLAQRIQRVIEEPPHEEFVGNINFIREGQETRRRIVEMFNNN